MSDEQTGQDDIRNAPRMDAYYFSFDETNVPEIDLVLSAVAWAGKLAHHTEMWDEPIASGPSSVAWIQASATAAADEIGRLRRERDALRAEVDRLKHELGTVQSRAAHDSNRQRQWQDALERKMEKLRHNLAQEEAFIAALQAKVDAIDAMHQPVADAGIMVCKACALIAPCPTHRILHPEGDTPNG